MTEYIFTNNASGTLLTDVGSGDNSITLDSGEGALFPNPSAGEAFYVLVSGGGETEWMLGTSRSSDTIQVTRTDPKSFLAGATVKLVLNATILDSFFQKGTEREYAGSPDGVLAANYTGEEVLDTTNSVWYKHITGTTWKIMNGTGS